MRDRCLLNLLLACATLALASIAYWRPGEDAPVDLLRISRLQAEDVQNIDLHRRGQQSMAFTRGSDGWRLTAPSEGPADQNKVGALLDILDTRSATAQIGAELKKFKLSEPRATLRFDKELWSFGASHPLDGRRYVLHEGTIHLVDALFFHHLIAEASVYTTNHGDALLPAEGAAETITDPSPQLAPDPEPH